MLSAILGFWVDGTTAAEKWQVGAAITTTQLLKSAQAQ
jgi:hypothetical protein